VIDFLSQEKEANSKSNFNIESILSKVEKILIAKPKANSKPMKKKSLKIRKLKNFSM
jgi:hypothetical protein